MKLEKNFLNEEEFKTLNSNIMNNYFPWYYIDHVGTREDKNFYMCHLIYDEFKIMSNYGWDIIQPIINKLNAKSIIRIKANLYGKSEKIIKHAYHYDREYECKTSLYFLNTNNGYTQFKKNNKKFKSIENSMVHFDSRELHHSTTCSDKNVRVTISLTYF